MTCDSLPRPARSLLSLYVAAEYNPPTLGERLESVSADALVRLCVDSGDEAAWAEFVRRFGRLIAGVILRTARRWGETSPDVIDDLVQDTYLKLCGDKCRLLRGFKASHPDAIFGFLKVVTANLAHDHFRSSRAQMVGRTAPLDAADLPSQQPVTSKPALEQDLLLREVEALLHAHTTGESGRRDRAIFWLYYKHGFTARGIAALPSIGLSTKGVESVLFRLTSLLRAAIVSGPARLPDPDDARAEGISAAETF